MPRPKKAARFGGDPAHHNLILANLTTELFRHGRIRTTQAKAKTVQPLAEKMITFGKRGDVHARRQVLKVVRDKDVLHKLFADIGPANAERDGGYTRVLKLAPRKGDGAAMALIELVEAAEGGDGTDLMQEPRRRWSLRRRGGGTRSRRAREREEERLAAEDAGEDVDLGEASDDELYDDEIAQDESVDDSEELEGAEAGSLGITREDATVDPDAPQADPAEVEARLAAANDDEDDAVEVTEAPADSSVPPESPPAADDTEDADEDDR